MDWPIVRRNVVIAFWGTILLGVPMWYITTQISRATLPALPAFEAIKPTLPIRLIGLQTDQAEKIVKTLNVLQDEHVYSSNSSIEHEYTIHWQPVSEISSHFIPDSRGLALKGPSDSADDSIINSLLNIFEDERRRIASVTAPDNASRDLRVVKYNPTYELVFSLLNGGGAQGSNKWPIRESLSRVVQPLLDQFDLLAYFSLESQVQYYADLTFVPVIDEFTGEYVLQKSDLKNFINSAEWNLATAQSGSKPLNFIIYIPKPEHRPLVIKDGDQNIESNSFLLPQFGSIVIYNPPSDQTELPRDILDGLISTSSTHLLTLMGLPRISAPSGDASQWRRDGLLRQRTVELLISAQHTLKSLPKIVDQIPNMHVPAHITTLVNKALHSLSSAREALSIGDIESALTHSRSAVHHAEQAFFDDKMIALLYFPDEHKYGVYLPLFGPLFLPLVMAGIKEFQHFFKKRKRRPLQAQSVSHDHAE